MRAQHHRHSLRIPGYDYSQSGFYFVTLCTFSHKPLFGNIHDGQMHLSTLGTLATVTWQHIPDHFPDVALDAFILMPNHMHGIIILNSRGKACLAPTYARNRVADDKTSFGRPIENSLGVVIGSFKSAVTRGWGLQHAPQSDPIWQRNYYEHVIREENRLALIRRYVENNPTCWTNDRYFTT